MIKALLLLPLSFLGCTSNQQNVQLLHNIWMLEEINGTAINGFEERPSLEIYVEEARVVGFSGCNSFQGGLDSIESSTLIFGPLAMTRKYCAETAELESSYMMALEKVKSWEIKDNRLILFDREKEILEFGWTD